MNDAPWLEIAVALIAVGMVLLAAWAIWLTLWLHQGRDAAEHFLEHQTPAERRLRELR